jgi:hypothetical protein
MRVKRGLLLCLIGLLAGRMALLAQAPANPVAAQDGAAGAKAPVPAAPASPRLKPETEEALLLGEKALNAKHYDDAAKEFKRGVKIERPLLALLRATGGSANELAG